MAELPQSVQCLLFVICKAPMPRGLWGTPPLELWSHLTVYALTPSDKLNRYIGDIFTRIGITVIKDTQFDPFLIQAVRSKQVELIEILIKHNGINNYNHLLIYARPRKKKVVNAVFMGLHVDFETYSSFFWSKSASHDKFKVESVFNDENLCIIKELLSHGTGFRYLMAWKDEDDGSFLHFAVEKHHEPLVRLLLENGAQVDESTVNGRTPLHYAVNCNAPVSILELLVQHGANINAKLTVIFQGGTTPLLLALRGGSCKLSLCKFLLENGALVNTRSNLGSSIFDYAIRTVDPDVLSLILSWTPNLHTFQNVGEFRYMFQVASKDHEIRNVKILLNRGFNIGPECAKGYGYIQGAFLIDCPTIAKDLLKWGMTVFHPGDDLKNALIRAIVFRRNLNINRSFESIRLFFEMESSCSSELHVSVLKEAIISENTPAVAEILGYGDLKSYFWFEEEFLSQLMKIFLKEKNTELKNVITKYISALLAAQILDIDRVWELYSQISLNSVKAAVIYWLEEVIPHLDAFETEFANMYEKDIVESGISFFAILHLDELELLRCLNDERIRNVLKDRTYHDDFPLYSGIISKRFHKAYYRITQKKDGIKMMSFISKDFRNLPHELKEVIIDYLSNIDLLILTNLCKLPPENGSDVS